MTITLICPACAAPGLSHEEGGAFRCEYCGTRLLAQRIACPSCGYANLEGSEDCTRCGEPLTVVARVLTRQGAIGPPFWLVRLRSQVASLKEKEAVASDRRLEQLKEVDRRRLLADAEAQARQRAKDREIVLALGFGLAIFAGVVLVIAVIFIR